MAKSSKSVVIFSDIHVGSKVSVCSESPKIIDGEDYVPTKAQKALKQAWDSACSEITQKPDITVINGEPIDGANPKSQGSGIWSTNLIDQIRDFKVIAKKIPTSKKMIFVRGSGYHVNQGATNLEEVVAENMKADRHRAFGGSGFTDYEANIEMNGKNFNFTHHVGFSAWAQYRTTSLAREMVKLHFMRSKKGYHTDVVVRSHVHYFVSVAYPHSVGFTTPAFKFPDGFMYRSGIPSLPDVGCVEVIVESNGDVIVKPHIVEIEFTPKVMHI
ncbi:hypothetical protein N9988_00445 [bacterium]|jgi:hypothetical protein|nr:hypothetical protein [bacterium]